MNMMSLIFLVGFLSLLLLPLICLSIFYSLQFQHHQYTTSSAVASNNNILHSYLAHSNLSSVMKLLMFPYSTLSKTSAGVRRSEGGGEAAAAECSVCLCGIQEGEGTRELSCRHLFHSLCLDAWIGAGGATCPLCRGRVGFPAVDDPGAQVLLFRFCSFTSVSRRDQGHDNWWLR